MLKVICSVGGDAKGNPGLAAFGVSIADGQGAVLAEVGRAIGNASEQFATYNGVMVGLQTLTELFGDTTKNLSVELCLDNAVVKNQLNDESPLHDPGLVPMFIEIHNMRVTSFPQLRITLVTRDQNMVVQQLVREVLDGKV